MPNPALFVLLAHASLAVPAPEIPDDNPAWERTLDRVVPGVVSLRVTATRNFDTDNARSSVGTGFVVDAERGIILTNRHLVQSGPILAEAIFQNYAEVELIPIYRDPVHDFGFFRFDPAAVRDMEVVELQLDPQAARRGMEIRVIGNDAGEKLSILGGTLARLDRNAPYYGGDTYNDFNTFYLQAASNTSGGSSGSPVVDVEGRVVALNAGGSSRAASSFYLPLDRVVRALEHVRRGEPVPRGTLQTVFTYVPFDELRRLRLRDETAAEVQAERAAEGMLVVAETLPYGPASGALLPGDVLVRIEGRLATRFVEVAEVLDESVGEEVTLEVERAGERHEVSLFVGDKHAIMPDEYLEVGRAVLHELSYQQARNHNVPAWGIYVASSGYMLAGIPDGAILTEIDGEAVDTLDHLQALLEARPDGQRMRVRWHRVQDPNLSRVTVVNMDRRWHPMQRCRRDDTLGVWPCSAAAPPPELAPPAPAAVEPLEVSDRVARRVADGLVMVEYRVPHPTAGVRGLSTRGTGLVVDAAQGLVVVDRDTVPVALGELSLIFAGAVRVPGRLVYLHPVHNFAVVAYDPEAVAGVPVREVRLRDAPLAPGDKVWMVGLNGRYDVVSLDTHIDTFEPLRLGVANTPRFRDSNVEGARLRSSAASLGGALVDRRGRVVAGWFAFIDQASGDRAFHGLPTSFLEPVVGPLRRGETVDYRVLGAELGAVSLVEARDRGLADDRVQALRRADPTRRRVFEISRIAAGTPAAELLQGGDLLLTIDGEPVTRMRQVEAVHNREAVKLEVLRNGEVQALELSTVALHGRGVDRVVTWAGLIVHEPHWEVAAQRGVEPEGVYVAWMWYGSPAAAYRMRPTRRIIEVDGQPVRDLDDFLRAIAAHQHRDEVILTTVDLDRRQAPSTLKLDKHYWPAQLFELGPDGSWRRALVDKELIAEIEAERSASRATQSGRALR